MGFAVDTVDGLWTIAEVIALHDEAWKHSTGIIELLKRSTSCFVVTDDEDAVVAYAFVEEDARRGHVELQDIVVAPWLRGRGVGQLLLGAVMAAHDRIKLIAHADDDAVVGFYEKLGFVREAVIENYYSVDEDGLRLAWSAPARTTDQGER